MYIYIKKSFLSSDPCEIIFVSTTAESVCGCKTSLFKHSSSETQHWSFKAFFKKYFLMFSGACWSFSAVLLKCRMWGFHSPPFPHILNGPQIPPNKLHSKSCRWYLRWIKKSCSILCPSLSKQKTWLLTHIQNALIDSRLWAEPAGSTSSFTLIPQIH